ncbi:MAG: hypothetical protein HY308_11800 [Gammaproteobacteria bacterium]|nr:hypothetical protein [Gammaproteobacteria bacterium]
MAGIIYALCTLTALTCAGLLLRSYIRNRYKLLLWSGLCFAVLSLNNILLIFDKMVFTEIDLSTWRLLTALFGPLLLLYGLISKDE